MANHQVIINRFPVIINPVALPVAQDEAPECEPIDVPTLVLCLKRLVKSVQKWNKHGGRQGYLAFMTQFVM